MKNALCLLLSTLIFLTGCGKEWNFHIDDSQITIEETIKIDVAKVEIVNNAPIEKAVRTGLYSTHTSPLGEHIQSRFQDAVIRLLDNLIVPNQDSYPKAIVRIDRAVVTASHQGEKNIPFIGILAFATGVPEEFTAVITGAVEIEDSKSHVISYTNFNTKTTITSTTAFSEEVQTAIDSVAKKALLELQTEVREKVNRYLYQYIASPQ